MKIWVILGILISGISNSWASSKVELTGARDPIQAQSAFDQIQKDAQTQDWMKDSESQFRFYQQVDGAGLSTTKFQHLYKGLEVVGSIAFSHHARKSHFVRKSLAHFDLDTAPSFDTSEAVLRSKSAAGDRDLVELPHLKILPSTDGASAKLIYWVKLQSTEKFGPVEVLLDAHSGQTIAVLNDRETLSQDNLNGADLREVISKTQPQNNSAQAPAPVNGLAPVEIYSAQNQGTLITATSKTSCTIEDMASGTTQKVKIPQCQKLAQSSQACQVILSDGQSGEPVIINPTACNQMVTDSQLSPTADASASRAYNNTTAVLNYYKQHFNRNSYDNAGSPVISIVHVGQAFDNAFWLQGQDIMSYGDGDGTQFGDFTIGMDVAGHEMTHGVTEHTAALMMMNESGALNEANSDFFGKMVEFSLNPKAGEDWVVGRNLFLNQQTGQVGIRDLSNPASLTDPGFNKPYPTNIQGEFTTTGACDQTNDVCGVHFNSTIRSHVSYLIFQALGQQKTELLFYTLLTQFMSAQSTFKSDAQDAMTACQQLFDAGSCAQVQNAYAQAGLI